jgi:hypothetical protein
MGEAGGRRRGTSNGLSTAERKELTRLRREVRPLEEERTILKKAAAGSNDECNAGSVWRCSRRYSRSVDGSSRIDSPAEEKLWRRRRDGQSLSEIGRALDNRHAGSIYGDLVQRDFTPTRADQLWVGVIT